jgi:hypothetical protein
MGEMRLQLVQQRAKYVAFCDNTGAENNGPVAVVQRGDVTGVDIAHPPTPAVDKPPPLRCQYARDVASSQSVKPPRRTPRHGEERC